MFHIQMRSEDGTQAVLLEQVMTVNDAKKPRVYGWTDRRENAMQMDADKAIIMHREIIACNGARGNLLTIEPAAKCLADQLDHHRTRGLASMIGANPESPVFLKTLRDTPALTLGDNSREVALAYLQTLAANIKAVQPGART